MLWFVAGDLPTEPLPHGRGLWLVGAAAVAAWLLWGSGSRR